MSKNDRRDSGAPEEVSPSTIGEEREQMLDHASTESALGALTPGPHASRPDPPARPAEADPPQAEPARAPEMPSVRLRMEDIERMSIKAPDRPSSTLPPEPACQAPAGYGDARLSKPPDAAALGNTMKALFDSRVAPVADGEVTASEAVASTVEAADTQDFSCGTAAAASEPFGPAAEAAAGADAKTPTRERAPAAQLTAAEAAPAVAGTDLSPEIEPAPAASSGSRARAAAAARTGASGKVIWLAGILGLFAAVAAWVAANGWPLLRPGEGGAYPLAPVRGASDPVAVLPPGAEPGKAPAESKAAQDKVESEPVKSASTEPPFAETAPAGAARLAVERRVKQPKRKPAVEQRVELRKRKPAVEQLPQVPDRDITKQALKGVLPAVRKCAAGKHGVAEVVLTVKNTGRVMHAVVRGDFAGTVEGSCIARAVRKTRLPPFLRPSFTLIYPFSL